MTETIIVAGSLAQRPGHGGHAWVFLQYLLGFRSLGYDVLFLDRLDQGMCVDVAGNPEEFAVSENVRFLEAVMDGVGLGSCWSVSYDGGRETAGLDRATVAARVERSTLLLNVMGYLDDDALVGVAPKTAFLDIDPGFGQMWRELGLHDMFVGHDHYVTVGTRLGADGCAVPTGGIDWITTLPPVALDAWPVAPPPLGPFRFTSIASWRGPFGPIEYNGRRYGLRAHEFRNFADLPSSVDATFEVALDIDPADGADRDRLLGFGWALTDPRHAAGGPARYQRYIEGSTAELMVAKNMYVATQGGWFSDRSACYLATGRPVLAQDTGFGDAVPTGTGIVPFRTFDDAVAGAHDIIGNYASHAAAARAVAEEYLDARVVLTRLLRELGVA